MMAYERRIALLDKRMGVDYPQEIVIIPYAGKSARGYCDVDRIMRVRIQFFRVPREG